MVRKAMAAIVTYLLLVSTGYAQQWTPLNADWEMMLEFDGKDTERTYVVDITQPSGIREVVTETIWPIEPPNLSHGARNLTTNPLLTPRWTSSGTIKATIRWRHTSAHPSVLPIRVSAATWASTAAAGGTYQVDSGIGAEIRDIVPGFGKIAALGPYLRKVKIGSDGKGVFEVEKVADSWFVGTNNSARAYGRGLSIEVESRDVTIIGQNSTNWPNRKKIGDIVTISLPASQDAWEWYQMADPHFQNRPFTYFTFVPEPAPISYPAGATDYSSWDLGFPSVFQFGLNYYDPNTGLPVTSWSPPQIDPVSSIFTATVQGQAVGDEYFWSGLTQIKSGILTSVPAGDELVYSGVLTPSIVQKQAFMNPSAMLLYTTHSFIVNNSSDAKTIDLKWVFGDGLEATSVRNVQFHSRREPGEVSSQTYRDFRVGSSPETTSYQEAIIVNPSGSPASEVPEAVGWISPGYTSAEFLPLSLGFMTAQSNATAEAVIFGILSVASISYPSLAYVTAALSIGMAASGNPNPGSVSAVFGRDEWTDGQIPGNGRWCDYLKVETESVRGTKAFNDLPGLLALKAQLAGRRGGTQDLYWKLKMRPIEEVHWQEVFLWGATGFEGQTFDDHAKQVSWPTCFKYYHFRSVEYIE